MISLSLKMFLIFFSNLMLFSKNPVKMSMVLLMMSLMIFFMMTLYSGLVWFPILFSLLFMGGILMMFMILSSILPNEKSIKLNILPITMISMILSSMAEMKMVDSSVPFKTTKSFLSSNFSFYFLILILILYFFSTITMLCKVEMPMRSLICCKSKF